MEFAVERDGTRLAGFDEGDGQRAILFLHGLAGHAGEWSSTAKHLPGDVRAVAADARGHGRSERTPVDVSLGAQTADAAFLVEQFGLAPVVVVGQSMGGLVAMLLAARRPELIAGLVVVEADPDQGSAETAAEVGAWLRSWQVPFRSRDEAVRFFGGSPGSAEAWAGGLEERPDGLWPAFDADVLREMLDDAIGRDYWTEWKAIECPILIVRGQRGELAAGRAERMAASVKGATVVEIEGAGHDAHLDQPESWQTALNAFMARLAE
jgi:pimeloyl-ACP methyl ester carboxylesterase